MNRITSNLLIITFFISSFSHAALTISQTPLFAQSNVPPNIMFTLDDSGSMKRDYLPESIGNVAGSACSGSGFNVQSYYGLSAGNNNSSLCNAANFNSMYYDSRITYTPRVKYDALSMGNSSATCSSPTVSVTECKVDVAATAGSSAEYITKTGTYLAQDGLNQPIYRSSCTGTTVGDDKKTCNVACSSPKSWPTTLTGTCPATLPATPTTWLYSNCYPSAATYESYATLVTPSAISCHSKRYAYCKKLAVDGGGVFIKESTVTVTNTGTFCTYNVETKAAVAQQNGTQSCTVKQYYQNPGNPGAVPFSSNDVANPPAVTDLNAIVGATTRTTALTTSPGCKYLKYTPQSATKKVRDTTLGNYTYVDINNKDTKNTTYDSRAYDVATSTADTTYRTDCVTNGPTACTFTEEQTNYQNWVKYYKTRWEAAQTYVGLAFKGLDPKLRVGYAQINKPVTESAAVPAGGDTNDTVILPVLPFTGGSATSNRAKFYTKLYATTVSALNANNTTPLRRAMDSVGQYFSRNTSAGSPWADNPDQMLNPGEFSACRQSYNLLMTDGYWTTENATTATGNIDGVDGTESISRPATLSYIYKSAAPYKDSWGDTLADVAMYYWNHDLAKNIDNKVPTTTDDAIAVWQHLTQYTIGFGVDGTLKRSDWASLADGTKNWPTPFNSCSTSTDAEDCPNNEKTDDLWHAAVNSRGQFYNAANPKAFVDALTSALKDIDAKSGSASALTTNSSTLSADSIIYQAGFSGGWVGYLRAFTLNTSGGVSLLKWSATLPSPASRNIFFRNNDGEPKSFSWDNLGSTQQAQLNKNISNIVDNLGSKRVDYLRGVKDPLEYSYGGPFRNRSGLLGDVVNSAVIYSGNTENYGYGNATSALSEKTSYAASLVSKKSRAPLVFVGANDGMLHAFKASDGSEQFAFIPSAIFPKLSALTSVDYSHQYYVDGSSVIGDAYINGWKTILLGATGAGAKSVFALDVTSTASFNTSNILWEFDDDADLGFTISKSAIVRLSNGKWVALVPNGYGSSNGHSVLFILDLADGSIISKIDTGVGSDNGLGSVAPVDVNGDKITDYVYAGDLHGNMWRFDLRSSNYSDWSASRLFMACDGTTCTSENIQPITARPEIKASPNGGLMVLFGTGSYFSIEDNTLASIPRIEAVYGVRDDLTNKTTSLNLTRSSLVKQDILAEINPSMSNALTSAIRVISNNTEEGNISGWYLPLVYPSTANGMGERVVSDMIINSGRLLVTSIIPSSVLSCDSGGKSWLIEIDPLTGKRLDYSVFDVNGDNKINDADKVTITIDGKDILVVVSGKKADELRTGQTIVNYPKEVTKCDGDDCPNQGKISQGSSGQIITTLNKKSNSGSSRQSWRQIR